MNVNTRRINEPVVITAKENEYFPKAFVWRGQRHIVQAVERCWTISTRQWGGRTQRHYFRVRCAEGSFELFQDIAHNTWHLARFERAG